MRNIGRRYFFVGRAMRAGSDGTTTDRNLIENGTA